jgi:hypothetical protein
MTMPPDTALEPTAAVPAFEPLLQIHACSPSRRGSAFVVRRHLTTNTGRTMKTKLKHLSSRIKRWRILAIFVAALMLPMRSPAPPLPEPYFLSISQPLTNSVTITATNFYDGEDILLILQMQTNLTATNWINIQTNLGPIDGQAVFTNIPATNTCEFFRVEGIF